MTYLRFLSISELIVLKMQNYEFQQTPVSQRDTSHIDQYEMTPDKVKWRNDSNSFETHLLLSCAFLRIAPKISPMLILLK